MDIASIAVGALITILVAGVFYIFASRELKAEAKKLRKLNTMILLGMEHEGWIKVDRDASGEITGFAALLIRPEGIESAEAFGTPEIRQADAD